MKKIILLLSLVFSIIISNGQIVKDSTALLIIDIQDFYFPGGKSELVDPEPAAENAKLLLEEFRRIEGTIVHVKHNYEPGGDIHQLLEPLENELIITKDEVSCFNGTGLNEELKRKGIKYLVICGMQTHMCVEGATRAAYDLGYSCTLVSDACATKDLKFDNEVIEAQHVHLSTLATLRSYAKVVKVEVLLGDE